MADGMKLDATFVGEQIAMLCANWPNALKGRDAHRTVAVWREGLAGLDRDAVAGAVTVIIREDEHFPRIARIRIVAREWIRRNRGTDVVGRHTDGRTCPNCGDRYAVQRRWRIATTAVVGNAVAFRLTTAGDAVMLEPFERDLCRCAPPSPYTPDLSFDGPCVRVQDLTPYDQQRLAMQSRRALLAVGTPTWAKAGVASAPNAGVIAENVPERTAERAEAIA